MSRFEELLDAALLASRDCQRWSGGVVVVREGRLATARAAVLAEHRRLVEALCYARPILVAAYVDPSFIDAALAAGETNDG